VASESGGKRARLGLLQGHFAAILRMVIRAVAEQKNFAIVLQRRASRENIFAVSTVTTNSAAMALQV
jgi:hypothetical protein